jgi:hypothetical protein
VIAAAAALTAHSGGQDGQGERGSPDETDVVLA